MPAYFRFLTLLSKLLAQNNYQTTICADSMHQEHCPLVVFKPSDLQV